MKMINIDVNVRFIIPLFCFELGVRNPPLHYARELATSAQNRVRLILGSRLDGVLIWFLWAPSLFSVSLWLSNARLKLTTETQRTQRAHREEAQILVIKAYVRIS